MLGQKQCLKQAGVKAATFPSKLQEHAPYWHASNECPE
jgi:hypothetical protein